MACAQLTFQARFSWSPSGRLTDANLSLPTSLLANIPSSPGRGERKVDAVFSPTRKSETAPVAPKKPGSQNKRYWGHRPHLLRNRVQAGTRIQRFDDTDRWPVFAATLTSQAVGLDSVWAPRWRYGVRAVAARVNGAIHLLGRWAYKPGEDVGKDKPMVGCAVHVRSL